MCSEVGFAGWLGCTNSDPGAHGRADPHAASTGHHPDADPVPATAEATAAADAADATTAGGFPAPDPTGEDLLVSFFTLKSPNHGHVEAHAVTVDSHLEQPRQSSHGPSFIVATKCTPQLCILVLFLTDPKVET